MTKYDASSADVNPIGGMYVLIVSAAFDMKVKSRMLTSPSSKTDLKSFIDFAEKQFNMPILEEFLSATPTAELQPLSASFAQSDEADMGKNDR